MIALNLLRLLWIRQGFFVVVMGLLFMAFQFVICTVLAKANIGGVLEAIEETLPAFFQALLSSQFAAGLSERGMLAFGWNHPVTHALGTAVAIVLAARAMAGEVETGAVELLLSEPLSRATYVVTYVAFAALALGFVSLAGVAGTLGGQALYGLPLFAASKLLQLGLQFGLLQFAWFALVLAFSAGGREGGRVAMGGFVLALVSYFVQLIGGLWTDVSFLVPWTLHHSFSPQAILLSGAPQWRAVGTLFGVSLVGLGIAAAQFRRRDLP